MEKPHPILTHHPTTKGTFFNLGGSARQGAAEWYGKPGFSAIQAGTGYPPDRQTGFSPWQKLGRTVLKTKLSLYVPWIILVVFIPIIFSCEQVEEPKPSIKELKKELTDKGFQVFDYVDQKTKDTIIMQQYFVVFLKRGGGHQQSKEGIDSLQALHLAHLGKMYEAGHADISGPFGDDGDIRGITIYNVPTLQMADSLANLDPAVQAGSLQVEVHPWWAAKGFPLR